MNVAKCYDDFVQEAITRTKQASPDHLHTHLANGTSCFVLDIREPDEQMAGLIAGAVAVPRGLLEKHVDSQIKATNAAIYLVCQTGRRSALAADVLQNMGYTQVFSLQGGMSAWQAANLPIAKPAMQPSPLRVKVCSPAATPTQSRSNVLSWDDIRKEFPIVDRHVPVRGQGSLPLVYLDHAASTHPPERVLQRYCDFMAGEYANVHRGTHLLSREATKLFDEAYKVVANFIGGNLDSDCVVFTTNTTQAIDLCSHVMEGHPGRVLITDMEHHSNDLPHRKRSRVLRVSALPDGSLDMEHLERILRFNDIKLVAMTGASNITGWMPNIYQVAKMAHEHGAMIMVDAAQLLAHQAIDVRPPGHPEHIDFLAAAGHKAYAPFGSAFLYGPRHLLDAASPYTPGGGTATQVERLSVALVGSPDRHQGGTPNIGGVIALAEAIKFLASIGMPRVREHEMELTRAAFAGLRDIKGVTIYGPQDPDQRLGVISFNVADVSDMLAAAALSEEKALACRNGRFCSHVYTDQLLLSQGGYTCEAGAKPGAVRASFGLYNTMQDVERFIDGVRMLATRSWIGNYRIRNTEVSAEFAARCNDRWMESAG